MRLKTSYWCLFLILALCSCRTSLQHQEAEFLKKGQDRLSQRDYARAILEFKNASKVMPGDAEPLYQLGLAHLAMRDIRGAVIALRRANSLNPAHAGAKLKLAELMAGSRDKDTLERAAGWLQEILAASPDNVEAADTLALTKFQLGKSEDAIKQLEDTLRRFPSHLANSVELARLKLRQQDLAGAESALKSAVSSAPRSSSAALALGQFYVQVKRLGEAEAEIRRATELDPRNGPALLTLASLLTATARLDEADRLYQELAAIPEREYQPLHAIFLYRVGKREAALAEFQLLFKENPSDRTVRTGLIATYVELGRQAEANKVLADALKRNSKDVEALFQRSVLALQYGRAEAEQAIQDLRTVLQSYPNSPRAHFALAEALRLQGLDKSEKAELTEALRLDPLLLAARITLGRRFLATGNAQSALELWDVAPAAQTQLLGSVIERNWALLLMGKRQELHTILDKSLITAGKNPDLMLQEAILKAEEHAYADARREAKEILDSRPDDLRAGRLVMQTYAADHQPDQAAQWLQERVRQRPNSPQWAYFLGLWHMTAGKAADARKAFETAGSADPRFLVAQFALAQLDVQEHRIDAARQRLLAILASEPKNVSALEVLAGIEFQAGNIPAAMARYRSVLDLQPSNAMALNNLAYLSAPQDQDTALRLAEQAAEIAPDDPTIQDTLGYIYYRKGLYASAVSYLKASVDQAATPQRQYHLAMSYLKAGDRASGLKMLETALQKNPDLRNTEKDW